MIGSLLHVCRAGEGTDFASCVAPADFYLIAASNLQLKTLEFKRF